MKYNISPKGFSGICQYFFGDNYVAATNVREATSPVKVNNPEITPVQLNRDKQSPFVTAYAKAAETPPVFVDFEKKFNALSSTA